MTEAHVGSPLGKNSLHIKTHLDRDRLLEGLLQTLDRCVVVLDREGSVLYGSPSAASLFGASVEELERSGYHAPGLVLLRPDGSVMPREETASWRAIDENQVVRDVVLGIRQHDGMTRWVRTSASPLQEPGGAAVGAVVLLTDVTPQVRAERAQQRSEEHFRAVFERNPIPSYIWRWDGRDLRLETCNDAAIDNTGGQVLPFLRKTSIEVHGNQPHVLEALHRCLAEKSAFEEEIQYRYRGGGETRVYQARFTFVPPDLVLVYTDDITERRRAHRRARQFREALSQAHGFLLALSEAGQAVQQARTPEAVFRTTGAELEKLGYHVVVFDVAHDRKTMTVTHTSFQARILRAAERLAGLSARELRVGLAPDGFIAGVLAQGESVFTERPSDLVERGVPRLGRALARRLVGLLDIEQMVFAPMLDGDHVHVLCLAGSDLSVASIPAVNAFAGQAAIALRNARLFERQRQLAQQLVTVQEEERRRLAHALHDQAGQTLTALRLRLELIAEELPDEFASLRERLGHAAFGARAIMDQLRQVAHDLRPPMLDAVGLVPALKGLCQSLSNGSRLMITFEAADVPCLSDAISVTLYRFLQEALTNVAKHAGASSIHVKLGLDGESVTLSVADDGRGIDPQSARLDLGETGGMGIPAIRERLEGLGGQLQLESEPGQGSRLVAIIRLAEQE